MALRITSLTCEYAENALGVNLQSPVFGWKLASDERGAAQSAYRVTVCDESGRTVRDSGFVESDRQFGVEISGEPLLPMSEYTFTVTLRDKNGALTAPESSRFVTGFFKVSQWRAHWFRIWHYGGVHFFRREFELKRVGEIRYAYAFVGAFGEKGNSCVPFLNGERIGDAVCFPGATEYFTAHYAVFDVAHLLKEGKNALGLMLAKTASIIVKIKYNDGSEVFVDALRHEWKSAQGGGYRIGYEEDMQRGKFEELDAREAFEGFSRVGFDDSRWEPAGEEKPIIDLSPLFLRPQYCVVRSAQTLSPVKITELDGGRLVDFGRNMAGFVRFRLEGKRGETVELRYAEKLEENGRPLIPDWRNAFVRYTFATDGVEEFTPFFSHTGFRYVFVVGYGGKIEPDAFAAECIHSDLLSASRFECSDETVNRLCEVARRSFLSNLVNIPTDCPERERRGWTADAYAVCEAECFNFDMKNFFTLWLESMRDCQRGNGWIPVELPLSSDNCIDINWPAAAVFLPHELFRQYGDVRLVRHLLPMMKNWVDLLSGLCDEEYGFFGGFMSYKDWIAKEPASPEFLAAAYFFRAASMVAELAAQSGETADAERYAELAADVRRAINAKHLVCDGEGISYDTGSQSSNAHALRFGICEEENRARVTASLAADIEKRQTATTGFMGTACLLEALSENGRSDLAYKLLKNRNEGGWLYLLEKFDATTFPEHYNGAGSQNHAFLGSAPGLWIYKHLVGISPVEAGYRRVRIAPYVPEDMSFASASVDTVCGLVSAEWRRENGGVTLTVSLPPNVTGEADFCGKKVALESGVTVLTA